MKRFTFLFFLLLLISQIPVFSQDQQLVFGVCVHFEGKSLHDIQHELDLIADAGIRWIRYDFRWNNIEPRQGFFNFTHYDDVIRESSARNIQILGILDYGNEWASPAPSGAPKRERWLPLEEPWKNYVYRVVSRYRDAIQNWQIWNEPDVPQRWQPAPNAEEYSRLVKMTYGEIKEGNPNANIILGGMSGVDLPYLESLGQSGVFEYVDGIAFHPYCYPKPPDSSLPYWIHSVSSFIRKNVQRSVEEWITEIGWTTTRGPYGVSENAQADDLAKTFFLALDSPVKHLFWYDLIDDGENPADLEDHFGLTANDLREKPAYDILKHILRYFSDPLRKLTPDIRADSNNPSSLVWNEYYDMQKSEILIPIWTKGGSNMFTFLIPRKYLGAQIQLVDLLTNNSTPVQLEPKSFSRYQTEPIKATQTPKLLLIAPVIL